MVAKIDKSMFLTLCLFIRVALYVGNMAFKEVLLDSGWGPRYQHCCGLWHSELWRKKLATENGRKMKRNTFLTLRAHCLITLYVGNGAFKTALLDLGFGQGAEISPVLR